MTHMVGKAGLRVFNFLLICCLVSLATMSEAQSELDKLNIPDTHKQIVLVTSSGWNSATGVLQTYSRSNGNWEKEGKTVDVALGKNGLAWGRGLHANTSASEKVESDGKAPAGIFLFDFMFGYSQKPVVGTKFPYRQSTERDYFVDATDSKDYNSWRSIPAEQANEPKKYWASFERMKRKDHLYELGIIVQHNYMPAAKGKGSAIFLHVWRSPGSPTLGCTAMSIENLSKLMTWLDPEKEPLLIQVPQAMLGELSYDW